MCSSQISSLPRFFARSKLWKIVICHLWTLWWIVATQQQQRGAASSPTTSFSSLGGCEGFGTKSGQTAGFSWSIKPTSAHFNCFGCFVNFSLYVISFHRFGKECNFFDMHRALYARQAVNLKCTMRSGRARWFGMTWWEMSAKEVALIPFEMTTCKIEKLAIYCNLLQFTAIHCNLLAETAWLWDSQPWLVGMMITRTRY